MASDFGNSQDLVQIEKIEEATLLLKDGSLRQIVMVSGLNFALKSPEEQNVITASYQNFLNSLDFPIQIMVHSRKINIQKYLSDLEKRLSEETAPLLQNQISEYREFVRKFVEENAIMEKSFLVVVPWYPPILGGGKSGGLLGVFGLGKKAAPAAAEVEAHDRIKNNLEPLSQRVDQVVQGLAGAGLEAILLGNQELVELVYNLYNPETIEKENVPLPDNRN